MLIRAGVGVRVGGRRVAVGSWRVRVGVEVKGRRVAVGSRRVGVGVKRWPRTSAVGVRVAVVVGWTCPEPDRRVALGVLLAVPTLTLRAGVALAGRVGVVVGVGLAVGEEEGEAEAVGVGLAGEVVGVAATVLVPAGAVAVAAVVADGNGSRPGWPVGVGVIVLGTICSGAWQPDSKVRATKARAMTIRIGVARCEIIVGVTVIFWALMPLVGYQGREPGVCCRTGVHLL